MVFVDYRNFFWDKVVDTVFNVRDGRFIVEIGLV